MTTYYQITPPEKFDFCHHENWLKWIRFERFRQASGLHEKGDENQVNVSVYTMGDQADDILTFSLSEDDRKTYKTVKDKFENHFVKKHNVVFEQAKFNQGKQEGESVDTFITTLYGIAEHCEYGALHDMIRDQIVVGLRDTQLSEKLQLDAGLTLEKAITKACQSEAVKH